MAPPRKAVADGLLPVGDVQIPCYVLEDGTRLISQRGMQTTLGMSTSGGPAGAGAHRIAQFAEKLDAKYCDNNELPARADFLEKLRTPLIFVPVRGGNPAYGQEATVLIDLCELILNCRDSNLLTPRQRHYAEHAEKVIRAFAKVGIIAVIDEVTGYQYKRPHDELQKILAAYVLPEHRPWVKTIPQEFTKELYRVWGWETNGQRGPRYAGKLTRKLIYEQLPPVVLPKLDELNPANSNWQRKRRHHTFLTEKIGLDHFKAQLSGVMALLRASPNRRVFTSLFERAYGKQRNLAFEEEEDATG